MTLNYTLTKEQLLDFHKKHILNTLYYKSYCIEFFAFINLISLIMFISMESRFKTIIFIGFLIIVLFFFLIRKGYFLNNFKKTIFKVIYSHHNRKYLFNETMLTVNNIGITIETDFNKKIIKWKYIKDLYIIDSNMLIRSFTDYDMLIPASSIKSKDNLDNLINLFKENVLIYPEYIYPIDISFF